jgi:hypothetical protein
MRPIVFIENMVVVKLVDTQDCQSCALKSVRVRVPPELSSLIGFKI